MGTRFNMRHCCSIRKIFGHIATKNLAYLATALVVMSAIVLFGNDDVHGDPRLELKYIITETLGPDSFDPIQADKTQNLPVMRMLYATPLEVDSNNLLKSYLLKAFNYDEQNRKIVFEMRDGLKFSDGSPIVIGDVSLAIARLAYFRPDFPTLKHIVGVKEWAQSRKGLTKLPLGMAVVGNKLLIELDANVVSPLFRFCLELFAVVPSSCVDVITGDLKCKIPPGSGYFDIDSQSANRISFKKKEELSPFVEDIQFEKISFTYKTLREACSHGVDFDQVVTGSEIDFLASECEKKIDQENVEYLPASRFIILRFNPNIEPFKIPTNRRIFAEKVRNVLRRRNPKLIVERSLFPKLIPGYIDESSFHVSSGNQAREFVGKKIRLPSVHSFSSIVFESIIQAARELRMEVEIVPEAPIGEIVDLFLEGVMPVIPGSSGFWAQDPIGDVSMWLTRGLHKSMRFLWEDKNIYRAIRELEDELEPQEINMKMGSLNKYIFDKSIIAPLLHFRRMYISSKSGSTKLVLPYAITSPSPWHLKLVR